MNSRLSTLHRPALLLGLAVLIWYAFGRLDAGPAAPEFVPQEGIGSRFPLSMKPPAGPCPHGSPLRTRQGSTIRL